MLTRKTPLTRTAFKRGEIATERKYRTRKCAIKTCRAEFQPKSMLHKTCGPVCAQAYIEAEKARKLKRERQEGLQKLKKRADYLKEAQAALNKWIREVRDADKPCISCGRFHEGQWHAGHFLSRGSHPHLALVELNLAKQCQPCNVHLSGNQLMYRRGLIERIGLAAVELLESDMTPRKYSIEELKAMKAEYLKRIRDMKNEA